MEFPARRREVIPTSRAGFRRIVQTAVDINLLTAMATIANGEAASVLP